MSPSVKWVYSKYLPIGDEDLNQHSIGHIYLTVVDKDIHLTTVIWRLGVELSGRALALDFQHCEKNNIKQILTYMNLLNEIQEIDSR